MASNRDLGIHSILFPMYTNLVTRMFKDLGCIAIVQVHLLGVIALLLFLCVHRASRFLSPPVDTAPPVSSPETIFWRCVVKLTVL